MQRVWNLKFSNTFQQFNGFQYRKNGNTGTKMSAERPQVRWRQQQCDLKGRVPRYTELSNKTNN